VEEDRSPLLSSGADVIFWIDANLFATQFPDYLIKAFLRPRFVNPFENSNCVCMWSFMTNLKPKWNRC